MSNDHKTKLSDLFNSSPNQGGYGSMANPQDGGAMNEDLSNPFATDVKSDMAVSQMSMDMSGFSQFFDKQSGSSKRLAVLLAVLLVVGGGFFLFTSESSKTDDDMDMSDNFAGEDDDYDSFGDDDNDLGDNDADEDLYTADSTDSEDATDDDDADLYDDEGDADSMDASGEYTGSLRIVTPMDGQARSYDETSEYALFEWEGASDVTVLFSRNKNMMPLEKQVRVSGSSYRLAHPWPGTWYWQVQGDDGSISEVSRFVVDAPLRRNVALSGFASPLSGNGGVVSWVGDTKVARYTVELSQSGWSNPAWRYQTSGTSITLNGLTSGQYQLRLGAFSEVAGRWEYTQPVDVVIE